MANTWSKELSQAINTLHILEPAWFKTRLKGSETVGIEHTIQELVSHMTDEQLDVCGKYEKERFKQANDEKERLSQLIEEMKAEQVPRTIK